MKQLQLQPLALPPVVLAREGLVQAVDRMHQVALLLEVLEVEVGGWVPHKLLQGVPTSSPCLALCAMKVRQW